MNNNNPLFSIIVPVYNNEKIISKCIESILKQTVQDFELIIIDDGSSDNTYSICNKYTQENTKILLLQQENHGVSSARNLGIQHASGKWCIFVDSDDTLKENHLEELSKSETDITWIGYDMYDENGNLLLHRIVDQVKADTPSLFNQALFAICNEKNFFAIIWTKKFKLDIIKINNIQFDETVTICEDILFTHEYLKYCNSISCINSATYNYTYREGSLSHGGTDIKQYFIFIQKYLIFLNECKYDEKLKLLLKKDIENRFTYVMQKTFRPFSKIKKDFKYQIVKYGINFKYNMKYKNRYIIAKNIFFAYIFCYLNWFFFYLARKFKNILKKTLKL